MSKLSDTVSFDEIGVNRRTINGALKGARNQTMLQLIGNPRGSYNQDCRNPTNQRILDLVVTDDVGPFRATGLRPAIESLKAIFVDVRTSHPNIHDALSSAGMLCCRLVRDSQTSISNHSWGTAIDLKVEGKLDRRGDNRTQRALLDIHPIFNRHRFFWGASFRTEDAMHFEASEELVRDWSVQGLFGAPTGGVASDVVSIGDRGTLVEELQTRLNFALALDIDVDGIFGPATRASVMEFQRQAGLLVDGIVGNLTWAALRDATARHVA